MNNDTTVNVNIGATDSSAGVVQNAASNFSKLWEQIALGQGALQLAEKGFQLLEQAIVGSIKQAGDFQQQMTMLVTGAGESEANLGILSKGIKQIAIDTGTTLEQLTQGAYQIESAGFRGRDALNILKMAADGAKADGADLGTVTNALTTIMHDYNIPASQAAHVTDQMIAAVARGKMHMQDFAGSLSTVLPLANQVGLSFAQVAGAEATLTAGGVSADQATQNLHSLIASLIAPTSQQVTAMQQMGLSSVSLSQNIGKDGLTGTLKEMFDAITSHMGPDGLVLQSAFQNATLATQDMKKEISAMPASVQNLANQLMSGSLSFAAYRKEARALPEGLGNLAQQFEATYNKAHSFNAQLMAGVNASPTFTAEIKAMTGQTDAMNAVMMLTGSNFNTFQSNVKAVGDASRNTGSNISDWALIQKNFNQQWSEFQARIQVVAVAVGDALIKLIMWFGQLWRAIEPVYTAIASMFMPALEQLKKALEEQAKAFEPIWKVIKGPVIDGLVMLAALIVGPMIAALVAFGVAALVFIKVATWIADVVTWFYKLGVAIVNGISNPRKLLATVGKDIIQGLIDGMEGMLGDVGKTIGRVATTAVSAVKNLLGIHSPSTVFAEIGQNMGAGLIQGLQGIQPKATLAVSNLVTGNQPGSGTTNHYSTSYSSGGNSASVTIGQVVLASDSAVTEFFKHIDRDTQLQGMGLSPARGIG